MIAVTPHLAHTLTTTASVVRAVDLGKWYDNRCVLDAVNLDIVPGSLLTLLGANGAGKSTLLRMLATLTGISRGELFLFGEKATTASTALRARIGMIGHQPILYRDLSVMENLLFFGGLYGISEPRRRAEELLARVGLTDRGGDAVKNLSRGMTQRVAIARALMHDPPLLLADEPFAGLDAPSSTNLERLLNDLQHQGKTIILSNHDIAQSLRLARQVIVLRQGRVVIDRPASKVTVDHVMKEVCEP